MNRKKEKKQQLVELKPKKYRIYGIFNFKKNELIHVDLDLEKLTLEFDLECYNEDDFDIISFDIVLA